jgi:hypothetical protein
VTDWLEYNNTKMEDGKTEQTFEAASPTFKSHSRESGFLFVSKSCILMREMS